MVNELKRGTQIIYAPDHAGGDINHPDCERGFVITDKGESAFCRYFSKFSSIGNLRTIANSELTPKTNLIIKETCEQGVIDTWIEWITAEPEVYGHIG